jgi:hypothetical protein
MGGLLQIYAETAVFSPNRLPPQFGLPFFMSALRMKAYT